MSTPKLDPIGLFLLKWIVGPLVAVGLIAWGINYEMMKRKCRRMAAEQGYLEGTYFPQRRGSEEQCVCRKKQNPDGSIDETAKLVLKFN